jgi:hypothetical protein
MKKWTKNSLTFGRDFRVISPAKVFELTFVGALVYWVFLGLPDFWAA